MMTVIPRELGCQGNVVVIVEVDVVVVVVLAVVFVVVVVPRLLANSFPLYLQPSLISLLWLRRL